MTQHCDQHCIQGLATAQVKVKANPGGAIGGGSLLQQNSGYVQVGALELANSAKTGDLWNTSLAAVQRPWESSGIIGIMTKFCGHKQTPSALASATESSNTQQSTSLSLS